MQKELPIYKEGLTICSEGTVHDTVEEGPMQLGGQTRLTGWAFQSTGWVFAHPVNMLEEAL